MEKSHRHHYVPEFITKHFWDEDEKISVYDKITDRFYPGSPSNLFVVKNRNTFPNLDGEKDDVIENIYSSIDSFFSSTLIEITTTRKVSDHSFEILLLLAYVSKWRVPLYDESFKIAQEAFTVDELGLGFKNNREKRVDIKLEEYFKSEMQQEFKRILLALQPFRFSEDFKTLKQNSFLINTPIHSFISDCPFIEATLVSNNIFEDFVFPVTKDLTLVYSTRVKKSEIESFLLNGKPESVHSFIRDFSISRDISLLALAERNVACSNHKYLLHLVKTYKEAKSKGTGTQFHMTFFNLLYNFNKYRDR
jgi:hypothetical protein